MTTTPCPHAGGGILICDRCVQRMVEPPKKKDPPKPEDGATPSEPKDKKKQKGWTAELPDGRKFTFEKIGRNAARAALRALLKEDPPRSTKWEPLA